MSGRVTRRAVALGIAAGAASGPARAQAPAADEARVAAAVAGFARQTPLTQTPGVSAAVVLPGQRLVTGVAGWADPDRRLRMTPATRLMSDPPARPSAPPPP